MADILNAIKQETAVWQKKVEAAIPVFNESFTLGAYITLLERFYGFYSALDSSFGDSDGLKALLPDWRERRKIPSLEDDLLWLGCDFQNLLHVPVCRQMPVLNSIESVLGALYVTERSTLGGQAISRQLASSLRVMPGAGATFFYGYGEATEAKWKGFTAVLTSIATRANERLVIQSAIETYKRMWLWLSRDGNETAMPGVVARFSFKIPLATGQSRAADKVKSKAAGSE